ncbi:MAG: glutaminyl-tRNA synthase (glutamine-hydrolyzing) subunit B [Anaerolineaceae bacterium 4572_78]|nr:MAG: glutaminyl-tRNA synthase (glutamine-hydrolyzing) subunit B [Anaerolineaceae bacterium 4572_78]
MTKYKVIIGMEVHIELQTKGKLFTNVSADFFGKLPNRNVHPLCLGMPGTLPVINQEAVAYAIMTGSVLNCTVHPYSVFARKHYFYPDLPKGYQISQYEKPICTTGDIIIEVNGQAKQIGITRLHLEEDTGKLTHVEDGSLVDLNRAGVPLMEIVSEPDMRTAEEAYIYVNQIRQIVRYLGVSTGDMEKGAMRCEVNLSLKPIGSKVLGTKVEIKNLNSFRTVRNSIDYEIKRQTKVLDEGGKIEQVTMGWDEDNKKTVVRRRKEDAHDYRYFPEPDLPPLNLDPAWIEKIISTMPELPTSKVKRYVEEWGLSKEQANILTENSERAEYFERLVVTAKDNVPTKSIADWVQGELFRYLNETNVTIDDIKFTPDDFIRVIKLVKDGTINRLAGKEVLAEIWQTGDKPDQIIKAKGLKQISDSGALETIVDKVIADNPKPVAQFKGGKEATMKFLVGQVMRHSRGKANPKMAEKMLRKKLT